MKRKDLEQHFETLKNKAPELKGYSLRNADARCGRLVALVEEREHGSIRLKTEYMSYAEMNAFLYGYGSKLLNRFG